MAFGIEATPLSIRPGDRDLPVISDYALIGDCRTSALISQDGSIDWLCLPNFDSSSVFARLLDRQAGSCSIWPILPFTTSRSYIDGTAVIETIFTTETGSARVLDFMPILDGIKMLRPMREILRIVEGVSGTVEFLLQVNPQPNYARLKANLARRGQLGWCFFWRDEIMHVKTNIAITASRGSLRGNFNVNAGTRDYVSLAYTQGEPAIIPPLGPDADDRLDATVSWWQSWSAKLQYGGPYRDAVIRSAITLKLLSFAPSGAIIAAPTTSLPETVGGERNWDYRYCWLRDAGLTMQALVGLGIDQEAKSFLEWLLHATRLTSPRLRIMYDVYGRTGLMEHELPHLTGYQASRPVRIGNGAHGQQQADIYGEVIMAVASYVSTGGKIDPAGSHMLIGLGDVVRHLWQEPDSGIWEIRGPRRHFTFSKLMCWTALDRLLALHEAGVLDLGSKAAILCEEREAIATLIETRGYNKSLGAYTMELDGSTVDASLLLMSSVGFRGAHDPRVTSTNALILERLSRNGLVQRYESGIDGLAGDEAAFGICSFWAVEQIARMGATLEAEIAFKHLLSFGNDVGLFAEETDSQTGDATGNFPQAFTHVGLINTALAIERSRSASSTSQ